MLTSFLLFLFIKKSRINENEGYKWKLEKQEEMNIKK